MWLKISGTLTSQVVVGDLELIFTSAPVGTLHEATRLSYQIGSYTRIGK